MKTFVKIIATILSILAVVAMIAATIRLITIYQTEDCLHLPETKVDAIVVFGCGVSEDRTPSPLLKNRLDKAVELWEQDLAVYVVLTGDTNEAEDYDEIGVMKDYLVKAGVPAERIQTDGEGKSTSESIRNLQASYEGKSVILVTQEYHLYRAMYLGKASGITVYAAAAENAGSFGGMFYRSAREWAATVKDFFVATTIK